jgi:hypothetical protein
VGYTAYVHVLLPWLSYVPRRAEDTLVPWVARHARIRRCCLVCYIEKRLLCFYTACIARGESPWVSRSPSGVRIRVVRALSRLPPYPRRLLRAPLSLPPYLPPSLPSTPFSLLLRRVHRCCRISPTLASFPFALGRSPAVLQPASFRLKV